jgi:hypothetical protein
MSYPTTRAGSGVSANAASVTVPNTGLVTGDRRILFIDVANTTISNEGSLTGWTGITAAGGVALASTRRGYIFTCQANGSESTAFNFAAANNHAAYWFVVDGADNSNFVHVAPPTPTGNTSAGLTATSPDLTTTVVEALLLVAYFAFSTSATATFTTPTGMSVVGGQTGNNTSGHSMEVFSEGRPAVGAVGARSSTIGASAAWASMALAIEPAPTPSFMVPLL